MRARGPGPPPEFAASIMPFVGALERRGYSRQPTTAACEAVYSAYRSGLMLGASVSWRAPCVDGDRIESIADAAALDPTSAGGERRSS